MPEPESEDDESKRGEDSSLALDFPNDLLCSEADNTLLQDILLLLGLALRGFSDQGSSVL